MRERCANPKNKEFPNYGARGISVCDRWLSFPNFYADMGDPPPGYSLDRIDNDKGYSPDNCRWADSFTQAANQRKTIFVMLGGKSMPVSAACRELNRNPSVVNAIIDRVGVTHQAAIDMLASGAIPRRPPRSGAG